MAAGILGTGILAKRGIALDEEMRIASKTLAGLLKKGFSWPEEVLREGSFASRVFGKLLGRCSEPGPTEARKPLKRMAGTTGLEPAASAVTGQRSNQLNYVPTRQINEMRNNQCLCGFARFAYRAPVAPRLPKRARFLSEPPPNRLQISAFPCTSAMCKTASTDSSWRSRVLPTRAKPPAKLSQIFVTEIS